MEMFTRFNRKGIDDRQVDTLIGLSKGLTADGNVNHAEAEFLLSWLIQNRAATNNPIILNLLTRIASMFEDGVLDAEESDELLSILRQISGEQSVVGELGKTASLPINNPAPSIVFPERSFLFTGTCAFGTRKRCEEATEGLGGLNALGVSKTLNYLVLGTYVTDSWVHETFGRKIEKAMTYRNQGVPLVIITEEHWANEGRLGV